VFFKLFIEKRLLYACAIATASLVLASLAVTGLVMMSLALSDGLTLLFGHRWAGELGTGLVLLLIAAIAGFLIFRERFEEVNQSSKSEEGSNLVPEFIRWVKSHPEITLGAATVVGFFLASLITRPRKADQQPISPAEPGKSRHSGSYLAFLTEVLALARPLIISFLSAHWDSKSPGSSDNGSSAQPSAAAESEPISRPREHQSSAQEHPTS
jgi:hypothetical protein